MYIMGLVKSAVVKQKKRYKIIFKVSIFYLINHKKKKLVKCHATWSVIVSFKEEMKVKRHDLAT